MTEGPPETLLPDAAGAWLTVHGGSTQDDVLQALRQALEVESMCSRLQPLFAPEAQVQRIDLHHVSYNPRQGARIAYRLRLSDRQGNECVHFMAGLLRDAAKTRAAAMRRPAATWVRPRFGPGFQWLEAPDMALFGFPNDPKLCGIATLTPAALSHRLAAELHGAPVEPGEVVRYVPGKRLLMRYTAGGGRRSFYTKTLRRDRGRTALHVAELLWRQSETNAAAFVVARPLAYLAESQTLVQEDLQGWLPMRLPPAGGWLQWGTRLGQALARLHRTDLPGLVAWSPRDELAQLSRALQRLVRHDPSWHSLCRDVWEGAVRVPSQSSTPEVPVHTAFRTTQMLTREDRLALLDLEGFRCGDPHDDLANWVAHLCEQVVDGNLEWGEVESGTRAFLAAYADAVPWPLSHARLQWHTAIHLVSGYAKNALSRLDPDLATKVPALLEEAVRRLPPLSPNTASTGSRGLP